jgi:hypothetical protein
MGPGENFRIAAALQGARSEVGVAYAEKAAAPRIEHPGLCVTEVGDILGRQLARGVQADFVEHASKKDKATDLDVGTAETGDV